MRLSLTMKKRQKVHPLMLQIQHRERALLMNGEQYAARRAAKLARCLDRVLKNWK